MSVFVWEAPCDFTFFSFFHTTPQLSVTAGSSLMFHWAKRGHQTQRPSPSFHQSITTHILHPPWWVFFSHQFLFPDNHSATHPHYLKGSAPSVKHTLLHHQSTSIRSFFISTLVGSNISLLKANKWTSVDLPSPNQQASQRCPYHHITIRLLLITTGHLYSLEWFLHFQFHLIWLLRHPWPLCQK